MLCASCFSFFGSLLDSFAQKLHKSLKLTLIFVVYKDPRTFWVNLHAKIAAFIARKMDFISTPTILTDVFCALSIKTRRKFWLIFLGEMIKSNVLNRTLLWYNMLLLVYCQGIVFSPVCFNLKRRKKLKVSRIEIHHSDF